MSDQEHTDTEAEPEEPTAEDRGRPDAAGEGGGDPGDDGFAAPDGGEPDGDEVPEDLSEELRKELEELEELRDRHLRLAAEFENYRKRTRREMRETRERAQAALAERLLDALDDLERFLETPADETKAASLREGVQMVRDKLWKELSEAGLERMDPKGGPFDPEYHDALLTRPVEDPEESGKVSEILMNGYTFGDRVLRPARVEVTKHGGGEGAEDETTDEERPAGDD